MPQPLIPAFDRFALAAESLEQEATERFGQIHTFHGCSRREVRAVQGEITRLQRLGTLPSLDRFWNETALPRAARLREAAMPELNDAGDRLIDLVERLVDELRSSLAGTWIDGAAGSTVVRSTAAAAGQRLATVATTADDVDRLGEWWQRRLQAAAVGRSIVGRPGAGGPRRPADLELWLLDRPPWSYGDRYLTAFELVHSDIRGRAAAMADEVLGSATGLVGAGRPSADSGTGRPEGADAVAGPVIELRA